MSTDKGLQIPFYAKVTLFLLGFAALLAFLYVAQDIIIPLVFAAIVSIVLHPVVNFFIRLRINRVVSILIVLFLTFIVIVAFGALLFSQINQLTESWPKLIEKFTLILNQTISEISGNLNINPQIIHDWITKTREGLIETSTAAIGKTLLSLGSVLIVIFLIPVYIFLILFYQPIILEFIRRLFGTSHQTKVNEIVTQTKTVIQHYLIGLVLEAAIIATLYTTTLLILGIEYAILLGIIGALINVIPYIGGLVGVALPMLVAIATKSTIWPALYIMAIYYGIQLIDNNFIVPKIVASKVKINALFSIIVVIVGNALWGIPGMFLSIPLLAIVKLICDHIKQLKPVGFLLGDTMPPLLISHPYSRKLKSKSK